MDDSSLENLFQFSAYFEVLAIGVLFAWIIGFRLAQ